MSRAVIVLNCQRNRDKAARWMHELPHATRVEMKASKRTLPQNARMWAMLTDVASQTTHAGRKYTPEQWKVLFMHACGREVQFIPALDGATFIPWGQSSSDLSKAEMTDLIEFIFVWGAKNGVTFRDDTTEGG